MANRLENQVGLAIESTYNTPVTVTRFYPYIDGTDGVWDPRQRQGMSVFVGSRRGDRGDRRVLPIGQGTITLKSELASRQGGLLLQLAAGLGASTVVAGALYQRNFTPTITGTVMPSATIQLGKVRNDGTVDAETYAGCTAVSFEIECPEDGILTISVTFDARSYTTVTALATASYTAGAYLYDASQGSVTLGGAFTAPTTVGLATATTAYANVRTWKLAVTHDADLGRWVVGGRNQPTVGKANSIFTATVEANDVVLRTLSLAGTGFPLVITHTTTEVVGAGNSAFQVAFPQLFLTSPVNHPMSVETATLDISATATFNSTNDLWYIVERSADTTL